MLELITTTEGAAGKADMFISRDDDNHVSFVVVTDNKKQYDFGFEQKEWEEVKNWLDRNENKKNTEKE